MTIHRNVCRNKFLVDVKGDRELFFQANFRSSGLESTTFERKYFTTSFNFDNKLNTYKDADQLKIAHIITQTGPRKSDKIATKTKYFYYCIQTRLDNKDWILGLKITQLLED